MNHISPEKTLGCRGLALFSCLSAAAIATGAENNTAERQYDWEGVAALRFDLHLYEGGFNDGRPEFISRYTPLRSFDGDDFPGYFADLGELKLYQVDKTTGRRIFGVERNSLAYFNQKNGLFLDLEPFRLDLRYSLYRSQQMKPLNMPDIAGPPVIAGPVPGVLPNSIFAVFNDDSFGKTDYFVRRSDFGLNLKIRPDVFRDDNIQLGSVNLSYSHSDREAERFFDYVTTARLSTGANRNHVRWRGINQRVNEEVNRGGLSFYANPYRWIGIHYEFYVEHYRRRYNNSNLADVARIANVPINDLTQPSFEDPGRNDFWPLNQTSLGWAPSTTKLVNKLKFDKRIGPAVLNFGYANVLVDQDDFTDFAKDRGYDHGRLVNHSAFANWAMPLSRAANWNAHILYRQRDNGSKFPALDPQNRTDIRNGVPTTVYDYLNPQLDGGLHGALFAPFINKIETFKVGTEFTFALPVASSRIVAGWEREDTSRDLIFSNIPVGLVRAIDPNEALVRPDSLNDTLFINYSARPKSNLRVRWNNSATFGDEVGLISEAKTGYKSRVSASYSWLKVRKAATLDVFYQVRYKENGAFTITSRSNPPDNTLLSSARQEQEQLFQSAGLTFSILPSEKWTAYSGYVWHRDRLEANLLRTSARRYDNNWTFVSTDGTRFLTDAHTLFAGGSCQFRKRLRGTLDYSITAIRGDIGSGPIQAALGRDNDVENITHHVSAGLSFQVKPNWSLGGRYGYAVYDDKVQSSLDGSYHTFGIVTGFTF